MHTLIVGGTNGLGKEAVQQIAKKNRVVSVVGHHSKSNNLESGDQNVRFWYADISDTEKRIEMLNEIIDCNGRLNHLIFFQRYRGHGDSWNKELEISLTATKYLIEYLSDKFVDKGQKSVVMVSSVAAELIAREQDVGYHVAKAGMVQMARYYAVSLGKKNIRVNCISPALVLKEAAKPYYEQHLELKKLYETITPLGRMGSSRDVVNLIEFLCSSKASFITGQNIVVDGGLTVQMQSSLCAEHILNKER